MPTAPAAAQHLMRLPLAYRSVSGCGVTETRYSRVCKHAAAETRRGVADCFDTRALVNTYLVPQYPSRLWRRRSTGGEPLVLAAVGACGVRHRRDFGRTKVSW